MSTLVESAGDDDDQLMIQLQQGDRAAFDALVERYESKLIGFFFANSRDRQLAEDLTQETLLKLFDQAWDYLPTGKFRGWLFRIARNLLIDTVRRRSHDALIKSVHAPEDSDDLLAGVAGDIAQPEDRLRHRELAAVVEETLERAPDEQRLTFTLHHFAGLSLAEVATILETSVGTTKSRLRLARERLQQRLIDKGLADPSQMRWEDPVT